jgi:hypothetical protein
MIKKICFFVLTSFLISCNTEKFSDTKITKEINERITILNNSYKFKIIHENLQGKQFDVLKNLINQLYKNTSENELKNDYASIKKVFLNYGIEISDDGESKENILFNTLLGLDKLIFKYVPSRLNFSNYKVLVVPAKSEMKTGDTFDARLYLTVYDTLYEPQFEVLGKNLTSAPKEVYHLPSENGVGRIQIVERKKRVREIEGYTLYMNEIGSTDTLRWKYNYEVK